MSNTDWELSHDFDGDVPNKPAPRKAHEVVQPQGYFVGAHGDPIPWFDQYGRAIVLLCHPDGSVTWELRGKDGEVLEP